MILSRTISESLLLRSRKFLFFLLNFLFLLSFCSGILAQESTVITDAGAVKVETVGKNLNHPWGMAFLPDGRLLVSERAGTLRILEKDSTLTAPLRGTPEVFAKGQGGMLASMKKQ